MRIEFPRYAGVPALEVPEANLMGVYALGARPADRQAVRRALDRPIGTPPLRELARGRGSVLIVTDDVARPTPAWQVLPGVLADLHDAGVADSAIELLMALGTHRPMTEAEMRAKVGSDIYDRYPVHNHAWDDPDQLELIGTTDHGAEVWINRRVSRADLVIGIGRIMPIEICGFTGGGKILIPGCCGEVTNSDMHWTRVDVPSGAIIGRRDNPIRASIDAMARKAGLDFVVNVLMDAEQNVFDCVAGDLEAAHREGCRRALKYHRVRLPARPDVVVVDGYPFDIEFWQVNKALDAAGQAVRKGGAVIVVSPCHEGLSRTHEADLLRHGYPCVADVKRLVASGQIAHKVVGVHMIQVAQVSVETASVHLVTRPELAEAIRRVGLHYAATPNEALGAALAQVGPGARVAVLRGAAEMIPTFDGDAAAF